MNKELRKILGREAQRTAGNYEVQAMRYNYRRLYAELLQEEMTCQTKV